MKLRNKTVLVTGAASGNGKAIATLFAQEGAKVVLADLNKECVIQVAADLRQQGYETLAVKSGCYPRIRHRKNGFYICC